MKRHELLSYLQRNGCELMREGSKHSVWVNPTTKQTTAVPRHTEIVNVLAKKICKDLGIPAPS